MKIHLIRHGDAQDASTGGKDFDRDLSPLGNSQAALLAEKLAGKLNGLTVYCSTAQRTQRTLQHLQRTSDLGSVNFDPTLYLCSKETLLETIWKHEQSLDLVIVGHNFGLSDLLFYLANDPLQLQTCEYVCIDFPGFTANEISMSLGEVIDRFRPETSL